MNPAGQIVDDTKGKNEAAQAERPKGGARMAEEKPDQVMEKIQQQETDTGPILEAMLRESRGQSHWGLND